jgi:phospholipid-binding lipoprotein MlaA
MRANPVPAICLAVAAGLGGRAHAAASETDRVYDPAEGVNRKVFAVNQTIDKHLMRPIARGYVAVTPHLAREGVHNLVSNLKEPEVFINDLLQFHPVRAGSTLCRFALDTTVGVAGLIDVGSRVGLKGHDADFGQTFGRWGISPGPHLEVPILGPSDLRDFVGAGLGAVANPLSLATSTAATIAKSSMGAVGAVDDRARILPVTDRLTAEPDPYVAVRDAYGERRAKLVRLAMRRAEPASDDDRSPAEDAPDTVARRERVQP